jgi:predicted ArsR family transcriptional regulator
VPISIDEFETHDGGEEPTNPERVLRFLTANPDKAYKLIEIANATEVNNNSIHPVLKRLEEQGLVRHREPYWAVGDLNDVRDAMIFRSTAEFLDEEIGTKSRQEWLEAAEKAEESDV